MKTIRPLNDRVVVKLDGEECLVIREDDILGVVS
jgi:co-chaperonin GroES (HSP10)